MANGGNARLPVATAGPELDPAHFGQAVPADAVTLSPADVAEQLQRVLCSDGLVRSQSNRRLLSYLAERSLHGHDSPKEAEIAVDVFGRDAGFTGGDDSVVRVAARALRQKLLAYYAGPGANDPILLDIPKGSYRLTATARAVEPAAAPAVAPDPLAAPAPMPEVSVAGPSKPLPGHRRKWLAAAVLALLALSLGANLYLVQRGAQPVPVVQQARESTLWSGLATSDRPLMFLLGDIFMYTQTDPATGRTQTVRDTRINSSEDLRAFLATRPELAADRGLRYASYLQKSTAAGIAAILPLVNHSGREVEVRLREELMAEDMDRYDIVYLGPINRIGPLAAGINEGSRFRFDAATSGIADRKLAKVHAPEGELAGQHKDYALVSRLRAPGGNQILIITSGGRNAGLAQVVRSLTTEEGIARFDRSLAEAGVDGDGAFETLLSVTGYRQTDLAAEILQVESLERRDGSGAALAMEPETAP